MPTFAAIDIGSNSCRLKIARVVRHRLQTLHEDREVVRLGEGVFETGVASPESMANTIRALKRFHKAVQMHAADQVRVVATSAMRDARNSAAFIAWVKSATGWDVEIISGLEEGRLIHMGVVTHERGARGRCVLIDLGGGSCEITVSEEGRIREIISTPLGAVRLQQEFLKNDPPTREQIAGLRQFIARELRKVERKVGRPRARLVIATSGTAAALSEASLALAKSMGAKTRAAIAPDYAPLKAVQKLASKLGKMSNVQRASVPGIGPRRSEIIIGGAQVYADLLEYFELKGFRYSPMGLRDGMLARMLAQTDLSHQAHLRLEKDRWASVLELCKRYGVNPKRMEPVRHHVTQLYDRLKRVHELPPEYRQWLQAAAMMNEVGKFMNHQGHHRHTQYILANSEIYGFTTEQRALISGITRYLGKSRPDADDRVMRAIPAEEHGNVVRAVVLLRLAVALNQDRASDVLRVRPMVNSRRVLLELTAGRTGASLELWSLRKEADYFFEVFRRELLVELR
jgi:exopolyphosphatase/guanosine-5'-triphosphate,3'-diphosphate pyrophosphatase